MTTRKGAQVARRYHDEIVGPLLTRLCPHLVYAAARLGEGSDVLGLDDAMSTDHGWGLRLSVLLDDAGKVDEVRALLDAELPETFAGLPVRFPLNDDGPAILAVDVAGVAAFLQRRLGADPRQALTPHQWLGLTGQSVLEVVAGPVFADTGDLLGSARRRLRWYPEPLWLYVLAAGWQRVSQEMPFVGRTGMRGDDIGSRIIAARLARDLAHLAFLTERRWPPYPKWFGTVLADLPVAGVSAGLQQALAAADWPVREAGLVAAIDAVHARQVAAGLPVPATSPVEPFWSRPFRTVGASIVDGLTAAITDPQVRALPVGAGSVEQWIDNVDVLARPARRMAAAATL